MDRWSNKCFQKVKKLLPSFALRRQNERRGGEDPDSPAEPPVFRLPARIGQAVRHLETGEPDQRDHRANVQTCESVPETLKRESFCLVKHDESVVVDVLWR